MLTESATEKYFQCSLDYREMKSISIILVLICSFVVAHQSKVEVTSQGQKRKSENDIRQKFVKWKVSCEMGAFIFHSSLLL